MALPAVRQMYRRVPRAYIISPELKVLHLGAACPSTSTKVRDEGPFAIYYVRVKRAS